MARILIVGNATLDIVNSVDRYPAEDQELRATAQQITRGGNAANSAVVLAQLGHHCHWAGSLSDEANGEVISADLRHYGINLEHVHTVAHGKVPTSYIVLSRATGSRTIVHYRDLPEYPAEAFAAIELSQFDWLHFEGRNVGEVARMITRAKTVAPQLPLSLEVEKERSEMDKLLPFADLLLYSRDYAAQQGATSGETFLQGMAGIGLRAMISCTWGSEGAYALSPDGELHHVAAHKPSRVVDTLGAGDVFNAGMIDQLVQGESLQCALEAATRLAGTQCGIRGLDIGKKKL